MPAGGHRQGKDPSPRSPQGLAEVPRHDRPAARPTPPAQAAPPTETTPAVWPLPADPVGAPSGPPVQPQDDRPAALAPESPSPPLVGSSSPAPPPSPSTDTTPAPPRAGPPADRGHFGRGTWVILGLVGATAIVVILAASLIGPGRPSAHTSRAALTPASTTLAAPAARSHRGRKATHRHATHRHATHRRASARRLRTSSRRRHHA